MNAQVDLKKEMECSEGCDCKKPIISLEEVFARHDSKYPIYYYDPYTKEIIKGSNILPHEADFMYVAQLIYIGDEKSYKHKVKLGIDEFYTKSSSRVACVGKNSKTGEWFGWSHRGYGKFYPGYVVKEGSMLADEIAAGYSPKTDNHCRVLAFIFADLMD